MDLELTNTMPIGKYKSRTIEDIYKEDAAYLVWLRNARKEQNQDSRFFSREVSALLDMTIRESKQLQSKFRPWDLPIDQSVVSFATAGTPAPAQEEAYCGWGQF